LARREFASEHDGSSSVITSSRTAAAETPSKSSRSETRAGKMPGSNRERWRSGRLGFFFALGAFRPGILALGFGVAIDQLDDRHWRVVAMAEPGLDDPGIAAA